VPVRLTWPLAGRAEELSFIAAAVADPETRGIVIRGPAGVGKSRLAREALDHLAAGRCAVRWAVATVSSSALPLGAFASWAGPTGSDALALTRNAIDQLTSAPEGTTVVVAVDDAHLLDDLSAFVVSQMTQRDSVKVILTIRDGEPIPPAVLEIWAAGGFQRLDLKQLAPEETARLLAEALGGRVDQHAVRRLWKLTVGNVLYLCNIVEREVADGRLAQYDSVWRWTGDPVMPPGLIDLIESRMGELPDAVSDVVDLLAVGEPIELSPLTRLTSAAAVEDADARGLVTLNSVDDRVELRIAHPLYGEVRRGRAPLTRLRRLRGLLATELASGPTADDIRTVVRRAALCLESDLEPDPDLFFRAAGAAMWLDLSLADRLADAAVQSGAGVEANFVRSHILMWLSRGDEAEAVLSAASPDVLSGPDRGRLAFHRATIRHVSQRDPDGAHRYVEQTADTVPPEGRIHLQAYRAFHGAMMGRPEEALSVAHGIDIDEVADVVAARMMAWSIVIAAGDAGRELPRGAVAAPAPPVPVRTAVLTADAVITAGVLAGNLDIVTAEAEKLTRDEVAMTGDTRGLALSVLGRAALALGRLNEACAQLRAAVDIMAAAGDTTGWCYRARLSLTLALAISGDADGAAAQLLEARRSRHPAWGRMDFAIELTHAWVLAVTRTLPEAIRHAWSAAETARAKGQLAVEVTALEAAVRLGDSSAADRLRELAGIVDGPRVGLAARLAEALGGGDGDELGAVSRAYEEMGDPLAALDAASLAAVVHRRADRNGAALTCSARASELARRCGGAVTPALREAEQRLPLTDREIEIARLIAEGLSTREIADRLTLSPRTVEGHIYRAMGKTAATDREELGRMVPGRDGFE